MFTSFRRSPAPTQAPPPARVTPPADAVDAPHARDAIDATVLLNVLARLKEGDFSARMPHDWTGVAGKAADSLNEVIVAGQAFGAELARVSRVVGDQGQLRHRASLAGPIRSWSSGIDSVNSLIDDLVRPTIEMQRVIGAVADGDLSKKVSAAVSGDMLELKNTVNAMIDQLDAFAGEVTRVAHEVGVEGKLGGQARSTGVGGVWKDLTDNVNQLAANLTNQVRAISEVATAVTAGDLTRQVCMEASGEVAVLKDKLNEMIRNLHETTRQNIEQDWLKTSRERFTRVLHGQHDLLDVADIVLSELADLVSAQHGVFYSVNGPSDGEEQVLRLQAGYGYQERKHLSTSFRLGEGLVGQCAKERKRILLTEVPGDYVKINSGLGDAAPLNIVVLPVLFEGSLQAVVELASFSPFSVVHQTFLDSITESIGIVLNTIAASGRTRTLLEQSLSLAEELRSQQEELRESNADLGRQARLLAEQNIQADRKNKEVEESKRQVEEKVRELAVSSRYKSEFIANMSHELRTPLNSLLILAEQLRDDPGHTMTDLQVEYADVIRSSGRDLLGLLTSILDLAKAESGTVRLEPAPVSVETLRATLLREFEHLAAAKGLDFRVDVAPGVPDLVTDSQRLGQILRNLVGNAVKFTGGGTVHVEVSTVDRGWSAGTDALAGAASVVAFSVVDTGIGIHPDDHERIFQPFAQIDAGTARAYGGTGLGLSISRELVQLLGGEISVASVPGQGSTFTVLVPAGRPADLPATASTPAIAVPTITVPRRPKASPRGLLPVGDGVSPAPAVVGVPGEGPETGRAWGTERRALTALDGRPFAGSKVLVVDDDFRNVFALTALLERGYAEVVGVESGPDALDALERHADIDLVLMDIMMPVMDGYQTIRAIRAQERFASLHILAVTGKVVTGERERCLEAGADGYVPKPVDTAQLIASIGPWLRPASAAS